MRMSESSGSRVPRTVLDRVIGYFAPVQGLARLRSRMMLSVATGEGGYTGGRRDRRGLRRWRPAEGSADADLLPDLAALRARTRDLARNTPIATGAIATAVTNVVGDGLMLQASIDRKALGLSDEAADAWEEAVEREWGLFCKSADFTRVQNFYELQALLFRAALESGDCFLVRRFRKDAGDTYGTKLQTLEADRISNPNRAADSEKIAGGVEIDGDGVPVAYYVTDRHPGALRATALRWEKVVARTADGKQLVIHLFDRLRPEQTRGAPYLAPVIEHLKQLGDYSDAEVRAAVISAMFTGFVTTKSDPSAEHAVVGERNSTLAENELQFEEGAMIRLDPGEEVDVPVPGRPNAEFDPFVQAFLRQIGVALELPFELLIKHFTASYSASRAALEMAWQFFRRRRTWLADRLCQVVYGWMVEEAVASGRLSAPGFFEDPLVAEAYLGAEWIGPARASVDPKKEAEADEIDVRLGTKTRRQICMERTGGDVEDKTRQLGKERALREEAGLKDAEAAVKPETESSNGGSDREADEAVPRRRSA